VSYPKLMPSDIEAHRLDDLLADARAIPAALFTRATCARRKVIDLTAIPVQRRVVQIPEATATLIADAEYQLVGYCR
jgi:hypothetical protein